jgi:hypothetical protein
MPETPYTDHALKGLKASPSLAAAGAELSAAHENEGDHAIAEAGARYDLDVKRRTGAFGKAAFATLTALPGDICASLDEIKGTHQVEEDHAAAERTAEARLGRSSNVR